MFKGYFPSKRIKTKTTAIIAAVVILITTAVSLYEDYGEFVRAREVVTQTLDNLSVHFIDVGQGDSTLIKSPNGKFMLIDCGPTNSADYLVKYLDSAGVESLEYLIISHPHEDHYGGAQKVIKNYDIENFIIANGFEKSYPYDKYINSLLDDKSSDCNIILADLNDTFDFADCAKFMILSPKEPDFSDLNDASLVLKLVFGGTSFLFTGDAEKASERNILSGGYDVRANVLKAGHHGSSTSNTYSFLEEVSPEYTVISCGKDNDYGHPHKEVVSDLADIGTEILRTDLLSDIVISSDGIKVEYVENRNFSNNIAEEKSKSNNGSLFLEYLENLYSKFAA